MNLAAAKAVARELQLICAPRTNVVFHGLSMEPILREGDRVILEPVTLDEIQVGQIVTYRYEDKCPTRRVVARRADSVVLWCDNWPSLRFRTRATDILGRVVGRIREGQQLNIDEPDWQEQTDKALRAYRRSHLSYLRRWTRRAVARYVLRQRLPPLPG